MANEIVTSPNVGEIHPTSGTDGSRPSGFAGNLFDRIQKAIPSGATPKPEDIPAEVVTPKEATPVELAKTDEAKTDDTKAAAPGIKRTRSAPTPPRKPAAKAPRR